ncbi:MAG: PDZ domain-containing protein [Candidatus Rokubacteria bacterium]|nr:PDZ domain-containing protein [Candidatus Rokubacteria bacterium]
MSRRRLLALLVAAAVVLPTVAEAATWGWLGVRIRDLSEQEMEEISSRHGIREGYGALIVEVLKETPAARAGLQNGDLVVAFKDRPVVDTRALQRFVAATPAGQEVALTILRAEEGRRALRVSVGVMPREIVAERVAAEFGFVVRDPQEGREAPVIPAGVPAVAVVLRGSQAERAGLKAGDVIFEVNGRPVLSRQAVSEVLGELTLDQPLRLTVRREGEPLALTVAPPGTRFP